MIPAYMLELARRLRMPGALTLYDRKCPFCFRPFTAINPRVSFCCPEHGAAHYRLSNGAAA